MRSYEDSLKYYRDMKNFPDTAKEEGQEEGREEIKIAKSALQEGLTIELIQKLTGLTRKQIEELNNK